MEIQHSFHGRQRELRLLRELQAAVRDQGGSRFAVIAGKRRVGKTCLIRTALPPDEAMPQIFFYVNAQLGPAPNLKAFTETIRQSLGIAYPIAARSFEEALGIVFEEARRRPVTLVIDEFQNIPDVAPDFLDALQRIWDQRRAVSRLLLVVAGSGESAMREIFEREQSPLHARSDTFIRLKPFSPELVKSILDEERPNHSGDDLLALYAFTGGVAQHLQVFLEAKALTLEDMLREGVRSGSGWLMEAQLLIAEEFRSNAQTFNELLALVAQGRARRSELAENFDVNISGHLSKLENVFGLLERVEPLGRNGAERGRIRYAVADELLDLWYAFILPNMSELKTGRFDALRDRIRLAWPAWSLRSLRRFWLRYFRSLGIFTEVGPWWDRKGLNEIDLIAINSIRERIVFAEIRRSASANDQAALEFKAEAFLTHNPEYRRYERRFLRLSLEELAAGRRLPYEDAGV